MGGILDKILSFVRQKKQEPQISAVSQYKSPAGPGLGYHNDYAQFNPQNKFTGIANVSGVNTGGGGNTGAAASIYNQGPSASDQGMLDRAAKSYQGTLDAIRARLGMARSVRDEVVNNIGTTYGNLRTGLKNKLGTSLENLNQEDVGVQNTYGQAAGTARKSYESAVLRNRLQARAMNRLDSSFYDDRQADTNQQGANAISTLGTEEAGKRTAIGTRKTETQNFFEQQSANLEAEEAQLKSQADREYQSEATDPTEANMAEDRYQSRLDSIEEYIRNKQVTLAGIASSGGNAANAINSYNVLSPALQSALDNKRALTNAQTMNLPTFTSVAQPQSNPLALGNTGGLSAFEQLQRLLGNTIA